MPQPTMKKPSLRRLTALAGTALLAATGALALAAPAQADAVVQIAGPAGPLPVGAPYTVTVVVPSDGMWEVKLDVAGAGATITNVHSSDWAWWCDVQGGTAVCDNLADAYDPTTFTVTVLPATPGTVTTTATAFDFSEHAVGSDSLSTQIAAPPFPFSGFTGPVQNEPVVNEMNAGRAVPVKFSLGGDRGLDILAGGSPSSTVTACDGGAIAPVSETTASNSGLTYDAATDTYTYVWKTDKAWAGTCRTLHVTLSDGTDHTASFRFR